MFRGRSAVAGRPAGRRRARSAGVLVLLAAVGSGGGPARAADDVATYLEQRGLTELLARHLEAQMETATGGERDELRERLGAIFAELVESVQDPARRADLEARSRALLEGAPTRSTARLRLALLRASYRGAERTAEQHRLALAESAEVDDARATLASLDAELRQLRQELDEEFERNHRRLGRASGSDAIAFAEARDEAELRRDETSFLLAWVLYYRAWLTSEAAPARDAEALFAELLDLPPNLVRPDQVSVDLRASEPVARCILGMALSRSLTASTETSLQWLQLLSHPRTWAPLREQLPVWRLAILLDHGAWVPALQELDTLFAADAPVETAWLRLVAVSSLQAQERSRPAADLARRSVMALATRGELEQVFDLGERFGLESLGARGFAYAYVDGVLRFREALNRHPSDEPPVDAETIRLFEVAQRSLEQALGAADAKAYPDALPECRRLVARCSFVLGRYDEAEAEFQAAAVGLDGDAAADALWMAIVSLDRQLETEDQPSTRRRLARLSDEFLARFPANPNAPTLILRRAMAESARSPVTARQLLSIPETSAVHDAARRRAARIYYHLFREARGVEREAHGREYLRIALPLFTAGGRDLDPTDGAATATRLAWGRSILEVALARELSRLVAARQVLEWMERWHDRWPEVMAGVFPELEYRRVQERTLSDDFPAARALADRLWEEHRDDAWTERAIRTVFTDADRRWRARSADGGDDRDAVSAVARYGERMIALLGPDASFADPNVLAVHRVTARALARQHEQGGDPGVGARALELYRGLLGTRPRNATFLRAAAGLAERTGAESEALGYWRTLVSGLDAADPAWFEARFHVVTLLERETPDAALAVLEQHRLLHPDYGPDPWGPRLRAMHRRLMPAAPEGSGDGV